MVRKNSHGVTCKYIKYEGKIPHFCYFLLFSPMSLPHKRPIKIFYILLEFFNI